jgi:hypothetical protein
MTSAYSESELIGRARQMQYEKFQSRIGGTLWDSLSSYIRNSPVFFATRLILPLSLMAETKTRWCHGTKHKISLLGKTNKNCIFLQYHGEPHWPMKTAKQD